MNISLKVILIVPFGRFFLFIFHLWGTATFLQKISTFRANTLYRYTHHIRKLVIYLCLHCIWKIFKTKLINKYKIKCNELGNVFKYKAFCWLYNVHERIWYIIQTRAIATLFIPKLYFTYNLFSFYFIFWLFGATVVLFWLIKLRARAIYWCANVIWFTFSAKEELNYPLYRDFHVV